LFQYQPRSGFISDVSVDEGDKVHCIVVDFLSKYVKNQKFLAKLDLKQNCNDNKLDLNFLSQMMSHTHLACSLNQTGSLPAGMFVRWGVPVDNVLWF
jgi:hypothetical protein